MNVRELIEALQKFDPELPVEIEWYDTEYGGEHEAVAVARQERHAPRLLNATFHYDYVALRY